MPLIRVAPRIISWLNGPSEKDSWALEMPDMSRRAVKKRTLFFIIYKLAGLWDFKKREYFDMNYSGTRM